MEGTPSPYVAFGLASLDVAVESDSFVQINSSDLLVVIDSSDPDGVLGTGVTIFGSQSQADVPFIISFDDGTSAGLDVVLTLTLYHNGDPTGDITTINLHILDNDNLDRPTNIIVTGDSVAEDAASGTVVGTLSTVDPNDPIPGDSFTYSLNDMRNFVIVGNEIQVADNSHINFETQPTQSLQVVTTDAAGHSFVKDITITITDVPVDLDIVSGELIQGVTEGSSAQVDLKLSDVDPVSITNVSGDVDFFTLVNAPVAPGTGPFNFSVVFNPQDFETPLDADHDNVYDYTITASDGVNSTTRTFHFTVVDVSPETLNGTDDGDTLTGGSGIELIFGFAGNDILNGMGNNDTLTGGLDKDWMTGGLGADIFNFDLKTETLKGGAKRDVVMDFNHFEGDHIDLSSIDAKKGAGNQAFKFIGGKAFHDRAGELHYIKKAGFLLVEGDINGDGRADFQIEVHGVTKLGGLDFFR
jgi:Ca2+-binding RTX toxin-like protein